MLYKTLLKLKELKGLSDDLKKKIDVFFAVGRIAEEQYNALMGIEPVTEEIEEQYNPLMGIEPVTEEIVN